jgi:hypothetical protein
LLGRTVIHPGDRYVLSVGKSCPDRNFVPSWWEKKHTYTLMKAKFLSYLTLFEPYYHTVHYLSCFTLVSKQGLKVYFSPKNIYLQDFCHNLA